MDNSNSKSTNPRDPEYYKGRYPDRLAPPVKSAADEVTVAVSKELINKKLSGFKTMDLLRPSDQPPPSFNDRPIYVGISSFRYLKRKDWMLSGSKMTSEELNQIEDAFENFINEVEWEDD